MGRGRSWSWVRPAPSRPARSTISPRWRSFCRTESLWFHVDAAFGAFAMLAPSLRPLLSGIEQADSVAFDFHKWAQVPYDAGCILVRDARPPHGDFRPARRIFAARSARPRRRPPLALRLWPGSLARLPGSQGLDDAESLRGGAAWRDCSADLRLAQTLAARVDAEPALERLAPVTLNIVCFRYAAAGARPRSAECRYRRRSPGSRDRRALDDDDRWAARHPGRDREPPHPAGGHRNASGRGAFRRAIAKCASRLSSADFGSTTKLPAAPGRSPAQSV